MGFQSGAHEVPTLNVARLAACLFALLIVWAGASEVAGQARASSGDPEAASPWYRLTGGGAGMRFTCDLCAPVRDPGPAVRLSVGAHAGPPLRVGLEGGGWTHEERTVGQPTHGLGLVAHVGLQVLGFLTLSWVWVLIPLILYAAFCAVLYAVFHLVGPPS
jgi:hypothetical protein